MTRVGGWLAERQSTLMAYALTAALFIVGVIHSPGFASGSSIRQMLVFASFVGFAALGQTLVILAGGLDLSVPWLMAFGGVELSRLSASGTPAGLGVVIVIAIGVGIGLLNGVGATWMRVPPIVMTLAMGGLIQAYLLAVGQLSSSGDTVPSIAVGLASNRAGPVPVIAIVWLVIAIATGVLIGRTAFGRRVHATGENDLAARLSGIRVDRVRIVTYAISGAASAFGGIVLAGYVGTTYLEIGAPYLFTSIAAVVVGGASILGGRGTYWGTVAGALTLTVLSALLPLFHLNTADLEIVYGVVILLGVWASGGGRMLGGIRLRRAGPEGVRPGAQEGSDAAA
ncbi:MAG TPA: ABC transporter permease [Solirubrobacteraceae bacterium]|nr:ABC transporter permease [Solirubrobacteraceae bacterium]